MAGQNDSYRSKVNRMISDYELSGLGDELEHRWTRKSDRDSLRDLAEYFNKQLLASALNDSEIETLEGDIDNIYWNLRGDSISQGARQETVNFLTQYGIDVDSLLADFVSYQAIRTYLKKYRNAEAPSTQYDSTTHRESKLRTVQQLMSRLSTVTTGSITELNNADHLALGEFEVIVTVNIHCSDCGSRFSVSELLGQGRCQCRSDP